MGGVCVALAYSAASSIGGRNAPLSSGGGGDFSKADRMGRSICLSNSACKKLRNTGNPTLLSIGPALSGGRARMWGPCNRGTVRDSRDTAFARVFANARALKYRTPAEQQPDRAIELGAKQASYEALNARQLRKVPLARRDLIWAATEQCGLSDAPAVPPGVLADAETVARAAQRNELLRVQGVSTVWDHVTEMEVTSFWREERGLEKGSTYLKQLLKFAAKKTAGTSNDVPGLRRLTAAFDAAAERHPHLALDTNRLLSTTPSFTSITDDDDTVEERAEAFMRNAETLRNVLLGRSKAFSLYSCSPPLLHFPRDKLIERAEFLTELLLSVGLTWSDMSIQSWFGALINLEPEALKANVRNLTMRFSAESLPRMVQSFPFVVGLSPMHIDASIQALAEALAVPRKDAVRAIIRHANILRVAPSTVTDAVATLASIPELGAAVAVELCVQYPNVALRKSTVLLEKWQSLRVATDLNAEWHDEFINWPSNIARLANVIKLSTACHQRLHFLADKEECSESLVASRGAYTWLRKADFDELCPRYQEWLRERSVD